MSLKTKKIILPSRTQILNILQKIKNPFNEKINQSIVEAGFIIAPVSRIINNIIQISLIFDIKNNDKKIGKLLENEIKKLLINKTKIKIINFLNFLNLKNKKYDLILNKKFMTNKNNIKNIILIASGKGGVGKSTISANLAIALKIENYKVGLLDADIYGPSIPTIFGLNEKSQIDKNQQIKPLKKYGIKLMSIGFIINKNKAMIWRGPIIQKAIIKMINNCLWNNLDYLIIDLPPGTGDIQLTLIQKFKIKGVIIVSTPQILSLDDVNRTIQMFNITNIPILGIIENMAYFKSNDGIKNYIFGKDGAKLIAKKLKINLLSQIPLILTIGKQADIGEPIVHLMPNSIEANYYKKIIKKIIKILK